MEPRRIDSETDRPGPGRGSGSGRALVIEPHVRNRMPASASARAALRSPAAKLDEAVGLAQAIDLEVVETGIVPVGGIRPATRFECELEDPVLKRSLRHAYDVIVLPVRG